MLLNLTTKIGNTTSSAYDQIIAGAKNYIQNGVDTPRGATSAEMSKMQGYQDHSNDLGGDSITSGTSGSGSTTDYTELIKKYSPNADPLDDPNLEAVSNEELAKKILF